MYFDDDRIFLALFLVVMLLAAAIGGYVGSLLAFAVTA